MTAVLRSIEYLEFTVPDECNTQEMSTIYNDWQASLKLISQNSIKKIAKICLEFTERIRLLDSTIFLEHKFSEFLQNISGVKDNEEILPKISNEKQTMEDNEEASSNKNKFDMMNINLNEFLEWGGETEEEICQSEAEQIESTAFNMWILSTGKNVSKVLETFRSEIPKKKVYIPIVSTYFNEEIKKLFTDDEWSEMKSDFNKTVEFKDINEKDGLYKLFDKI
nr:270_t:CDS:2 [Entrophospora candida]